MTRNRCTCRLPEMKVRAGIVQILATVDTDPGRILGRVRRLSPPVLFRMPSETCYRVLRNAISAARSSNESARPN
jgi:hypothetical protein